MNINHYYNNLNEIQFKMYEEKAMEMCAEQIGVKKLDESQINIFQALKEVYIKKVMLEELGKKQEKLKVEHKRDRNIVEEKKSIFDNLWYEIILN